MTTPTPTLEKFPPTLIAIVGPSGAGKTTSMRNVNPATTVLYDVEGKGMPFKVSTEWDIRRVTSTRVFRDDFKKAAAQPHINLLFIDSITELLDILQRECEVSYKGFEIWAKYNDGIKDILDEFLACGKCVVITGLDEIVQIQGLDGQTTNQRRMFIQGNEWKQKGIESKCLAVWTAFGKKNADGRVSYHFATQTDGVTKAKTPIFWNLPHQIDNDVNAALKTAAKNL